MGSGALSVGGGRVISLWWQTWLESVGGGGCFISLWWCPQMVLGCWWGQGELDSAL